MKSSEKHSRIRISALSIAAAFCLVTLVCHSKLSPELLVFGQSQPGGTAQTGLIITVAGTGTAGFSGDGGPATLAQLSSPGGVADIAGALFIADIDNQRIRSVLQFIAGSPISTFAGLGTAGVSGDGGPASTAQFNGPTAVAVDALGNVFIADSNSHRVRKVTLATGVISTVAGNGTAGFRGDGGAATAAQLNLPTGIAVDSAGDLFIADFNNQRIRQVTLGGVISTVAGTGTPGFAGDRGPATSAQLFLPIGVAVDSSGSLYIADQGNNRIRKVTGGIINTIAGSGTAGFSGDGGAATSAQLKGPSGVAVDLSDVPFISDSGNNRIRKVTEGVISTVAGTGTAGFSGDGGQATLAQLDRPTGVAVDVYGNLLIADQGNNRIRRVTAAGFNVLSFDARTIALSIPGTMDAAQQTSISLGLTSGFGAPLKGTLKVTAADPMVQFATGGTTASFTIQKGATQAVFDNPNGNVFQTGTVAGPITFTAMLVAAGQAVGNFQLPASTTVQNKAPTIKSVSISTTETSFNVVVVGFSTSRQLDQATFTFTGTNVTSTPINVDVRQTFTNWYQSSASVPFGSQFSLTIPFTTTGGALPAGTTVSGTLTNAVGVSATVIGR